MPPTTRSRVRVSPDQPSSSPPLTLTSSGVETISLKAVVSGCTATPTGGGSPVAVSGGKISGTLVDPTSNGCASLAGSDPAAGALGAKWTTDVKLLDKTSTIQAKSLQGGLTSDNNRAAFAIPGTTPNGTPSGSFQGTDAGAGDSLRATTVDTVSTLTAECSPGPPNSHGVSKPAKGIKKELTVPETGPAVTLN